MIHTIGRGQPMHLPGGHALPIRSSHAVQERRVQNGAQGRSAGDPHEHRRRGRRHAVVLDVPLSTGGVRRLQGDSARTGRIGGQDRGGIGDGSEGIDNQRPARGAASDGIDVSSLFVVGYMF